MKTTYLICLAIATGILPTAHALQPQNSAVAQAQVAQGAVNKHVSAGQITRERVGTGFGINESRDFSVNAATQYIVDGDAIVGEPTPAQAGNGSSAFVRLAPDATPNANAGTAEVVIIDTQLRGPVTATSPLKVLGQPVTVTANTVQVGIPLSGLTVGQSVEVSGQLDSNNSIAATRLALRTNAPVWRLTGTVTQVGATTIAVGAQVVNLTVAPINCGAGIAVGNYVEVRADAQTPFAAGTAITGATRIRCGTPIPAGTIVGAAAVVTGAISNVPTATSFAIGNVTVSYGAATVYRLGNVDDLDIGVRVEVEGVYATATVVTANKIRFLRDSIRFQAPVAAAGVQLGQSITILGKTVLNNAQLRDQDAIIATGLPALRLVEVRAYMDSAGVLHGTRVRDRGNPVLNKFKLQGPASDIVVATTTCKVLGITISAANSFTTPAGAPLTAAQFYATLTAGKLISIDSAQFDAATNTLSAGIVSVAEDDVPLRASFISTAAGAQVNGTIDNVGFDQLHRNGFDD